MLKRVIKIFVLLFLLETFTQSCIESLRLRNRIVGGLATKPGQYPWQVALRRSKYGHLHGAGSIIASNWILTAAHCLDGLKSIYIVVGTIRWKSRRAAVSLSNNFHMHPNFDSENYNHDIALIKLNKPLRFSVFVAPISLVSYKDRNNDFDDAQAVITGFGYISDGIANPFNDLLQAVVTIISNDECAHVYADTVLDSTICAVGEEKESICDGDSGGPLITRDRYGHIVQIGVISFSADTTCIENYPSAFARVSSYLDFIARVTNMTLH